MPRRRLGFLSVLLLLVLVAGLISIGLPEEPSAAVHCYDGDEDDAAVASARLPVLGDMAVGARAVVLLEAAPAAFESPFLETTTPPPIVEQSPTPPLRSPPVV
jgi:hypothetical protein